MATHAPGHDDRTCVASSEHDPEATRTALSADVAARAIPCSRHPRRARTSPAWLLVVLVLGTTAAVGADALSSTSPPLVANAGQSGFSTYAYALSWRSPGIGQRFTTGPHPQGYEIHWAGVRVDHLHADNGFEVSASIHRIRPGSYGLPGERIGTLRQHSSLRGGKLVRWLSPEVIIVRPNTTYMLVLECEQGCIDDSMVIFDVTASHAEDAVSTSGWSLADGLQRRRREPWYDWSTRLHDHSLRLAIGGRSRRFAPAAHGRTHAQGPRLAVADARVHEAPGASLGFALMLSEPSPSTVSVRYETGDVSAKAREDYVATSGLAVFAPGQTRRMVEVAVLDDAVDEGEETLRLRLSNAVGASIADGEAVGTIVNADPLQTVWLSRFGGTVAGHVTDAVSDRLSGPLTGARLGLAGRSVDLARAHDGEALALTLSGLARGFGAREAAAPDGGLPGSEAWPGRRAGVRDHPAVGAAQSRSATGRERLPGSWFHLPFDGGRSGPGYAAWGRVTTGGFDAEEVAGSGRLRLDGEVTTGILGADAAWERWLAGVAVSLSEGEGAFDDAGAGSGAVESTMTSVSPYVRLQLSERVRAWGLLGFGDGEMTIREAANESRAEVVTRTDIGMRLGAVGARGALLQGVESGGLDLAVKADAVLVEMGSEKAANTVATTAQTSRVRLIVEGNRVFELGEGSALMPGLEFGLRHDGGDAETGTGIEVGASLRYVDAALGLSVEARARTLLAHQAQRYEEWGASGAIRLDPGASGRGLSLSIAPTLGAASGGVERLWSMHHARGLVPHEEVDAARRLETEVGYGLALGGHRYTGTPYAGLGLAETGRAWRLGFRFGSVRPAAFDLELDLEGMLREEADYDGAEHGLMLRGRVRW